MEYLVTGWFVCGILGGIIAARKEAGCGGFALGVLFGPLGVIAAFALDSRELCPQCGTRYASGATECPNCHGALGEDSELDDIRFQCPKCQAFIARGSDLAGKRTRCENCKKTVTIPAAQAVRQKLTTLTTCPDCGRRVSKRAEACPGCGGPL